MTSGRTELSQREARQLAIRAQQLWDRPVGRPTAAAIAPLVRQLGAVQIDTISTLARSHQLVLNARLGPLPKGAAELGFWPEAATHFEYWSHAACILPIADWPLFEFRRAAYRARGLRWHEVPKQRLAKILRQIEVDGPVTTGDVGGARRAAGWWNWSDAKIALEWLLDIGELACVRRIGFRRQYDLASRAIPTAGTAIDPVHGLATLLQQSLSVLGVGTRDDILNVHFLRRPSKQQPQMQQAWQQFVDHTDVVAVRVAGWEQPAWASAGALERLDRSRGKRAVMLSPFDSLIWYRDRMERLFDMHHRIEAYTPEAKRVYGYYAMPVLMGDQLIARVDPNKTKHSLVAKRITFESAKPSDAEVKALATALQSAASWIHVEEVQLGECKPAAARSRLRQALTAMGVR